MDYSPHSCRFIFSAIIIKSIDQPIRCNYRYCILSKACTTRYCGISGELISAINLEISRILAIKQLIIRQIQTTYMCRKCYTCDIKSATKMLASISLSEWHRERRDRHEPQRTRRIQLCSLRSLRFMATVALLSKSDKIPLTNNQPYFGLAPFARFLPFLPPPDVKPGYRQ